MDAPNCKPPPRVRWEQVSQSATRRGTGTVRLRLGVMAAAVVAALAIWPSVVAAETIGPGSTATVTRPLAAKPYVDIESDLSMAAAAATVPGTPGAPVDVGFTMTNA